MTPFDGEAVCLSLAAYVIDRNDVDRRDQRLADLRGKSERERSVFFCRQGRCRRLGFPTRRRERIYQFTPRTAALRDREDTLSHRLNLLGQERNIPICECMPPPEGLHVKDAVVDRTAFVCPIKGEKEMPVRHVSLRYIQAGTVTGKPITAENVEDLVYVP